MKRITYWQTFGGTVEVPDDKVEAFKEAVENNTVDEEVCREVMLTFEATHYEGQVCEEEDCNEES